MPYAAPYPSPYASPYVPSYASPVTIDPMEGFHTHDGFYLHVHAGISATGFMSKQAGVKTNYVGGGFSSGVAVGGVIAHNLVLYGAFFGTDTTNPDKQVGGSSTTADLGEIGVGAVGPGLAYYFERCNLYLSATFGLAGFTANDVQRLPRRLVPVGGRVRLHGRQGVVGLARLGRRHRRRADGRVAQGQEHAGIDLVGERAVGPLFGDLQLTRPSPAPRPTGSPC